MSQENKEVARSFFECVNSGDFKTLEGLFARDFKLHIPMEQEPVEAGYYVNMIKGLRAAFPDFRLDVKNVLAEDDIVMVRDVQNATFDGEPFMGLEPTGNHFTGPEHPVFRIRDGKIQEMWNVFDTLGFMMFIGAVEPPKIERPPATASR